MTLQVVASGAVTATGAGSSVLEYDSDPDCHNKWIHSWGTVEPIPPNEALSVDVHIDASTSAYSVVGSASQLVGTFTFTQSGGPTCGGTLTGRDVFFVPGPRGEGITSDLSVIAGSATDPQNGWKFSWSLTSAADEDGDGEPDATDLCPGTPPGTPVDAAGCPMTPPDSDGDGEPDATDLCPGTPANTAVDDDGCPLQPADFDGDGDPDVTDPDDDNDGVIDIIDAFDHDPTETTDTDGDGIGNNADPDDDNDGVLDDADNCDESPPGLGGGPDGCGPSGGGCDPRFHRATTVAKVGTLGIDLFTVDIGVAWCQGDTVSVTFADPDGEVIAPNAARLLLDLVGCRFEQFDQSAPVIDEGGSTAFVEVEASFGASCNVAQSVLGLFAGSITKTFGTAAPWLANRLGRDSAERVADALHLRLVHQIEPYFGKWERYVARSLAGYPRLADAILVTSAAAVREALDQLHQLSAATVLRLYQRLATEALDRADVEQALEFLAQEFLSEALTARMEVPFWEPSISVRLPSSGDPVLTAATGNHYNLTITTDVREP